MLPCRLSNAEKQTLEAIVLLGSYTSTSTDDDPQDLEALEERGFVEREECGGTFTRNGRPRHDGIDVYRASPLAKLWLKSCRRVEEKAAAEVQGGETQQANGAFEEERTR